MSNYLFNINQNTSSVVKIGELQEYKQGIRGNFKIQRIPNKNQDVELSKIYIGYQDYYIGQATQEGDLLYILSSSCPNDTMQVQEVQDNFDFEFSLSGQPKKYKIINRTRFLNNSIISLGFDFEHCKVKIIDNVLVYGREGEQPQIPLINFLSHNIISPNSSFSIIPDRDCKIKNINIKSQITLYSSCQNILIGENCENIVIGKDCGDQDGQIKINDNCKNIIIGDNSGVNGNIIIEKNCENITIGNECGKQGLIVVQENSGNNGGKIEFGYQCGNQAMILISKNCANQQGSLLSLGCGQSQSFIGQSFTAVEGIQYGVYIL